MESCGPGTKILVPTLAFVHDRRGTSTNVLLYPYLPDVRSSIFNDDLPKCSVLHGNLQFSCLLTIKVNSILFGLEKLPMSFELRISSSPFFKCPRVHPCECGCIHNYSRALFLSAAWWIKLFFGWMEHLVDAWPYFPRLKGLIISNCGVSSTEFKSLSGRHLRVIWTKWSGNPKGLYGPLKGGVALDFLSARLNFTYEMIRVNESFFLPSRNERGLFSYLWNQECDLLVHDVTPIYDRSQIDMTTPWVFTNYALLIPVAGDTANINAVIKPFQWPVWWGLGLSVVCVMAVLTSFLFFFLHPPTKLDANEQVQTNRNNLGSQNRNGRLPVIKELLGKQYLYVIGVILSQGGLCTLNRLPFRLVAGVWCLAAFIFVQAYSSVLFTYVVAPVNLPLINSIYDIFEQSDIHLFLAKGVSLEILVSEPNRTGLYLKLGNKLNSSPHYKCYIKSDCIKKIARGSRNVYTDGVNYLKDVIKEDFKNTGKCNLQLAKEVFMITRVSFALQQNSPYTKSVNQGLLDLQQTGLIDHWDSWFRPMPPQCNGHAPSKPPRNQSSSLSIKNLTGAFLLLAFGLSLSLLAFLVEKIYFRLSACRSK